MLIYIAKIVACHTLFWLLYKAAFEKERMLRFNRFYLIATFALSLVIPLVNLPVAVPAVPAIETVFISTSAADFTAITPVSAAPAHSTFPWAHLLWGIWAAGAAMLFVRFVLNLWNMITTILRGRTNDLGGFKTVSVDTAGTPYTFLRWIFVPAGTAPEEEILTHERAHAAQWHTADRLFFELLAIALWFDPMVVFYRRSIELNHEYLADEAVLRRHGDMVKYQTLLIDNSLCRTSPGLANRFNQFPITKKRLIMMTKGKSQGKALMKQSTIIPLAALVVMLFGGRTPANSGVFSSDTHNTQSLEQIAQNAPEGTTGATQAQLEEYEQFVRRGVHTEERDGKKTTVFYSPKYSEGDLKRMGELYLIMTPEQRSRQLLHVYLSEPWKIVHPSREEFESWKDEKEHGIWLDGVRIANSELSKYSPGDIGRWFTSRLTRTAKNYGKHVYQTNIYTVEYVEKFNERLPEYSIYPYPKRP